jgi:polar amino acid transport system substrate-binding protein
MLSGLPVSRCVTALACLSLALGAVRAESTLRVRADTWLPFNGDPAAEKPGYAVEVLRAIFTPEGITVDYQTMTWEAALKAAAAGEIDAVIGANRKEATPLIAPEETIGVTRVGLFVLKTNTWDYANLHSLELKRMGAIESYSYWDSLDDYIKTHHEPQVVLFKGENPLDEAIKKLIAGEIDVVPETLPVFIWNVRAHGMKPADFRIAYLSEGDPIYVAFAPKGSDGARFAKLFTAGIRALRKKGELAKILSRYGLSDWE